MVAELENGTGLGEKPAGETMVMTLAASLLVARQRTDQPPLIRQLV
jgi:hypothetical protein